MNSTDILRAALWKIAIHGVPLGGTAPIEEDFDDSAGAYANGLNVARWKARVVALEALATAGDDSALAPLARARKLERERDAAQAQVDAFWTDYQGEPKPWLVAQA
ncbi:MAG TPA: hypothetical protein VGF33_10045 [Caulobacteraceae bacterium]|jgi:hypothetical protein